MDMNTALYDINSKHEAVLFVDFVMAGYHWTEHSVILDWTEGVPINPL